MWLMHEKRIPQYCKMMKLLSRREILKELYSKLMSKLVIKWRIQEEEEEEKLIV
jgi:hypothetical protein